MGLSGTDSISGLLNAESGLHNCSKCSVCDVKFPKCDFDLTTVVPHSLPLYIYTPATVHGSSEDQIHHLIISIWGSINNIFLEYGVPLKIYF